MWTNTTYTIKQLRPISLGLDDFFNFAENFPFDIEEPKFPKYNILKPTDTTYLIEMALAGYPKSGIDIENKDGVLTVSYKKETEDIKKPKVLHQGITKKSFSKSFALAETIVIKEANFIDGLLTISLEDVIPEDKKPTKIKIN